MSVLIIVLLQFNVIKPSAIKLSKHQLKERCFMLLLKQIHLFYQFQWLADCFASDLETQFDVSLQSFNYLKVYEVTVFQLFVFYYVLSASDAFIVKWQSE